MKARLAASVALGALLLTCGVVSAEDKEPCLPESQGMRLADSLNDVSLMVRLLQHLKGCEDPKLKRLMEMNLQWAAANAREAIDHGARFASPYFAVNMLTPVRAARLYASEHQMDAPPSPSDQAPDAGIKHNLEVVETWLLKNQ